MYEWNRPVSEYRGEFCWSYKEGYSREGRRPKEDERLSVDWKTLKSVKKKNEKFAAEETLRKQRVDREKQSGSTAIIVDTEGDEYEVCETAKEAVERLVKHDPRLASKYQEHIKKIDKKLVPYGTSYQSSFMKSTNIFPTAAAYEIAAEEFEKNQGLFEGPLTRPRRTEDTGEWDSKVVKYGISREDRNEVEPSETWEPLKCVRDEEPGGVVDGSHGRVRKKVSFADEGDAVRQKWVDKAHKELEETFKADPKGTEERRKRDQSIVSLSLKRSLQRPKIK